MRGLAIDPVASPIFLGTLKETADDEDDVVRDGARAALSRTSKGGARRWMYGAIDLANEL
ncbi:hypothetical protein [Tardibacter chloracetimidivorans]|uniref:hypothetical protein n=1 Tax=Tardibacter chloracetimidivorans TaxID=1921510 RepID=UPI001D0399C5|nr:hypothetical protein [Tardibacter chloracetimidivorans]